MTPLNERRAQEFKRRYLAGETLRQIGDDHGLTGERVRQILRSIGIGSLGRRRPRMLTEMGMRAARLYENGVRPREILSETGLTHCQLKLVLRKLGVERNPAGYWTTRPDDAEITARVCDLYRRGFDAHEIVERVDQIKFPETVYRYLRRGGVPARRRFNGVHRRSQVQVTAA